MRTDTLLPFFHRLPKRLPILALVLVLAVLGFSSRVSAQSNSSITGSTVVIDAGGGNITYDGKSQTTNPDFQGANLGSFDISNFNTALLLNGGSINTQETTPDVITGGRIAYRVRLSGSTANLSSGILNLTQAGNSTNGNRTFALNTANVNVIAGLTQGNYTLSLQFLADGVNDVTGDDFTITDPTNTFYRASFTLTGTRPTEPATSTTWTGGKNDNWFDPANWTQGIPTVGKDATIPDFGSGSTVQYPNIYSNSVKPNSTTTTVVQNPDGSTSTVTTQVPGYDNTNSGPAQTRGLIMQGSSQAQRSILRLVVGRLEVYGDFSNLQDSFIQRENTTISFTGTNQTISGSASGFVNVEINGGGTKSLQRNFAVQAGGTLTFVSGILSTNITDTNVSFVELAPASVVGGLLVPSGRIAGENETNYLRGFVKTSQATGVGSAQTFGNIGLTLTFIGNDPGIVTITRNTSENYQSISNGSNNKPSIRRLFGVRPADQQTNNGGLNATMVFRYLDNETTNLVPNNQTLDESKFALFVSTSSGDVFGQLGRDALNTGTNELTKTNVRTFATFTLSEFTSPLPVTLTAFAAKRVGQNAVVTWETVTELNSKGYEVQVSADGRNFRTLGFVASATPNSYQLQRYSFEDKEANKSGVRYYRLRQIDVDGKDSYYNPKVLTFGAAANGPTELKAFPNPFTDALYLTLSSAASGQGQLSITDMTGRVVRSQSVSLSAGTNDLTLAEAANLQRGIYVVRVVLPTGEVKTTRVSKQ